MHSGTHIYVFASTLGAPRHSSETGIFAVANYRACHGVNEGLTGNAYAIPLAQVGADHLHWSSIEPRVRNFLAFAEDRSDCVFQIPYLFDGVPLHSFSRFVQMMRRAPRNCLLCDEMLSLDRQVA